MIFLVFSMVRGLYNLVQLFFCLHYLRGNEIENSFCDCFYIVVICKLCIYRSKPNQLKPPKKTFTTPNVPPPKAPRKAQNDCFSNFAYFFLLSQQHSEKKRQILVKFLKKPSFLVFEFTKI